MSAALKVSELLLITTPEAIDDMLKASGTQDAKSDQQSIFSLDSDELDLVKGDFSYLDFILKEADHDKGRAANDQEVESDEEESETDSIVSELTSALGDEVWDEKKRPKSSRFKRKSLGNMSSTDFLFYNKEVCNKAINLINEKNIKESFKKGQAIKGNSRRAYLINKKVS
jgi:hypothetical protein